MGDIPIRFGDVHREHNRIVDYRGYFKIVTDDFFVIYAKTMNSFFDFLEGMNHCLFYSQSHGEYKNPDEKEQYPDVHVYLRKILSPLHYAAKRAYLQPPIGAMFMFYNVKIYPPNNHQDSVEDYDMCMTCFHGPGMLEDPDIIPHTQVNEHAELTNDTLHLVRLYIDKLYDYVFKDSNPQTAFKLNVYLASRKGEKETIKKLVFDKDDQGGRGLWVIDVIQNEKSFTIDFKDDYNTILIPYTLIFYSFFSGHQYTDYFSDNEEEQMTIDTRRWVARCEPFSNHLINIRDTFKIALNLVKPIYETYMLASDHDFYGDYTSMPAFKKPRMELVAREYQRNHLPLPEPDSSNSCIIS